MTLPRCYYFTIFQSGQHLGIPLNRLNKRRTNEHGVEWCRVVTDLRKAGDVQIASEAVHLPAKCIACDSDIHEVQQRLAAVNVF